MNFARIFSREYIRVGLEFSDRDQALREIARLAKTSPDAESVTEEQIFDALRDRENLCSTGFGDNIAIPHCKVEGLKDFIAGIITVPDGVDFDAVDHKDIKLIVFLIGPVDEVNEHIRLLALIAQKLNETEVVQKLLSVDSAEALIQYFEDSGRNDLPSHCAHGGHEIVNIFVQDEDWFNEILQILSGFEDSQVVVLEAQYEGSYLAKLPFFANVWTDKDHKFCKMIVANVEKSSTGQIIRKIDRLVDGLKDCDRVMITVQPLLYMAGSLQL
jgi:PTS system nitrogen regulatory IIA component